MRHGAIRLLMPAVYAVTLVAMVAPTEAATSSRHVRKHHAQQSHLQSHGLRNSWAAGDVRPIAPQLDRGGDVCPGNARAIDCRIWPPPVLDDPDRKGAGGDSM